MAQMSSIVQVLQLLLLRQMLWGVEWALDCAKMAQSVSSLVTFVMERETAVMDQMKKDVVSFWENVAHFEVKISGVNVE